MVRVGCVMLLILAAPAAGLGKPAGQDRGFQLPPKTDFRGFAPDGPAVQAEIAPNTRFGLGIFGLKLEKSPLRPATVREIETPKQRRAALGFSVRF